MGAKKDSVPIVIVRKRKKSTESSKCCFKLCVFVASVIALMAAYHNGYEYGVANGTRVLYVKEITHIHAVLFFQVCPDDDCRQKKIASLKEHMEHLKDDYAKQLQQLLEMGFEDHNANMNAL